MKVKLYFRFNYISLLFIETSNVRNINFIYVYVWMNLNQLLFVCLSEFSMKDIFPKYFLRITELFFLMAVKIYLVSNFSYRFKNSKQNSETEFE